MRLWWQLVKSGVSPVSALYCVTGWRWLPHRAALQERNG
jgi:hypothetical protein